MKKILLILSIIAIASTHFYAAAAQSQHQHKHGDQLPNIALNNGEKWEIDESLHIGMSGIKQAMQDNIDSIHNKQFSDSEYVELADVLNKEMNYMFTHCQLPPQADAQLHILLARIAQGIEHMKHEENKRDGAVKVIVSLKDYPKYFNDPQWQSLQH